MTTEPEDKDQYYWNVWFNPSNRWTNHTCSSRGYRNQNPQQPWVMSYQEAEDYYNEIMSLCDIDRSYFTIKKFSAIHAVPASLPSKSIDYRATGSTGPQCPQSIKDSLRTPEAKFGPVNDHICSACLNDKCSKMESSCWRCGFKFHNK